MKKSLLFILFISAITGSASAQLKKAFVKDLAFMAGTWTLKHEWVIWKNFGGRRWATTS
ncbi:hypothetical protein ABIB62_002815 [Mucilaginibacter sp. UYP25]|uniref:hypothetical protein n=1 Tax=unclassified Mucilaginibacter TaxID=2617802 RepID=UPI003397D605